MTRGAIFGRDDADFGVSFASHATFGAAGVNETARGFGTGRSAGSRLRSHSVRSGRVEMFRREKPLSCAVFASGNCGIRNANGSFRILERGISVVHSSCPVVSSQFAPALSAFRAARVGFRKAVARPAERMNREALPFRRGREDDPGQLGAGASSRQH